MAAPESVIEIGSTGVRLLVAELLSDGTQNILDRSEMPLPLGKDVFTSGVISQETQNLLIQILILFASSLPAGEFPLLNVPVLRLAPFVMQKTAILLWTEFLFNPVFISASLTVSKKTS